MLWIAVRMSPVSSLLNWGMVNIVADSKRARSGTGGENGPACPLPDTVQSRVSTAAA